MSWNGENRLVSATKNGVTETYAYDVDGNRIKKTSNGTVTRTYFPVYEQEGGTTIKYYVFNGMRVAVKRGSSLYYLHGDHLSSTSLTTNTGGGQTASRTYYAYGSTRSSSGTLQTDRTFTGQKSDDTGLLYYNARYYDPALGTFLSPDTLVPDPGAVIDYNRYLYARGNPLRYSDPTGHYIYEDKPDDPFVWYGDKPAKGLVRTAEPVYVPTLDQGSQQQEATLKRGTLTIGIGGSVFVLGGVRGGAGISLDRNGNVAFHVAIGGGGYTAVGASGIGPSVTVTNASHVDLLNGEAVQFGGQVGEVASVGAEAVFFADADRNKYFGATLAGGAALQGPFPGELHATVEHDIFFLSTSWSEIGETLSDILGFSDGQERTNEEVEQ